MNPINNFIPHPNRSMLSNSLTNDLVQLEMDTTNGLDEQTFLILNNFPLQMEEKTPIGRLRVILKVLITNNQDIALDYFLRKISRDQKNELLESLDKNGNSILHNLVTSKRSQTPISILISHGAPLVQNNLGQTPLHTAAAYNTIRLLASPLVKHYPPSFLKHALNLQDHEGNTALHLSPSPSHELSRYFLKLGANPEILNKEGCAALNKKLTQRVKQTTLLWRKFRKTVNLSREVTSCDLRHPISSRQALLLFAEADHKQAFTIYKSRIDEVCEILTTVASHYTTQMRRVNSTMQIIESLEKIQGKVDLLVLGAHAPGTRRTGENYLLLGKNQRGRIKLNKLDLRLVSTLYTKLTRDATVIFLACAFGKEAPKKKLSIPQQLASQLRGITVIASDRNSSWSSTKFNPKNPKEVRFFDHATKRASRGDFTRESTVIFQEETRVKLSFYREKLIRSNYFK